MNQENLEKIKKEKYLLRNNGLLVKGGINMNKREYRSTDPNFKNEGQKTTPRLDELQYEIANEVGFKKIAKEAGRVTKRKENPKM